MEKLEKILNDVKPGINFMEEKDLINDGILTSYDIVTLVAILSNEFGISLGLTDLVPENFKSINTIYDMIKNKMEA